MNADWYYKKIFPFQKFKPKDGFDKLDSLKMEIDYGS
jgi:hypothetical protein